MSTFSDRLYYYCPNCFKIIKTAKLGDLETCIGCFVVSYLDKGHIVVRHGYNQYLAEIMEEVLV